MSSSSFGKCTQTCVVTGTDVLWETFWSFQTWIWHLQGHSCHTNVYVSVCMTPWAHTHTCPELSVTPSHMQTSLLWSPLSIWCPPQGSESTSCSWNISSVLLPAMKADIQQKCQSECQGETSGQGSTRQHLKCEVVAEKRPHLTLRQTEPSNHQ